MKFVIPSLVLGGTVLLAIGISKAISELAVAGVVLLGVGILTGRYLGS